MRLLEVIAFDIASCTLIERAGAGRIELCADPASGGTTPSPGMIKKAQETVSIPVFVMIRPRGGDFLYSKDEFLVMQQDIQFCKSLGIKGIVTGILKYDGMVDYDRTAHLVDLAYPMEVTFHRAFDRVRDPFQSVTDIIQMGCKRILTSGLMPKASQGIGLLAKLIQETKKQIVIMPGSGINSNNIAHFAQTLDTNEFHTSARTLVDSQMDYTNTNMLEKLQHTQVDPSEIKSCVEKLSLYS